MVKYCSRDGNIKNNYVTKTNNIIIINEFFLPVDDKVLSYQLSFGNTMVYASRCLQT
jgi:hypothetical protein